MISSGFLKVAFVKVTETICMDVLETLELA